VITGLIRVKDLSYLHNKFIINSHCFNAHDKGIIHLFVDETHIYSASWDGFVNVWQKPISHISHSEIAHPYALEKRLKISDSIPTTITKKQDLLFIGDGSGKVRIFDKGKNFKEIYNKKIHNHRINQLKIYGKTLFSCSHDSTVGVWCIHRSSLSLVIQLYEHKGPVRCLDIIDNYLITGSADSTVKVWQILREKLSLKESIHFIECIKFLQKKHPSKREKREYYKEFSQLPKYLQKSVENRFISKNKDKTL